jgi:hypothetical protein
VASVTQHLADGGAGPMCREATIQKAAIREATIRDTTNRVMMSGIPLWNVR